MEMKIVNMNKIWLVWFSLSLSGSFVACMLVLFKPILRKFSRTWQYYIWLLVILRFLIPFSPNVSIIGGIFQQIDLYFNGESIKEENLSANVSNEKEQDLEKYRHKKIILQAPIKKKMDFFIMKQNIIGLVWIIIAMVLLIYKLFRYFQVVRIIKKESKTITDMQMLTALQKLCEKMRIKKEILLCVNPFLKSSMLVGLINPSIILHDENVQASELAYIIRHELVHYRHRDFFYKWLVELMVCLHWFNPVVYWIRKKVNQACEFSCDEAVISHLNSRERKAYGETLLNTIKVTNQRRKAFLSFSLNEDGKLIKERLEVIMKYQQKSKKNIFNALILTIVLFFGAVYMGIYSNAVSEHAEAETTVDSNHIKNKSSAYKQKNVTIDEVTVRYYDKDAKKYPYIHEIRSNNTKKTIVKVDTGMLAFDKKGNPLKLKWAGYNPPENKAKYYFLYDWGSTKLLSGKKEDLRGGWSLNEDGKDKNVTKIAYVLFCDKKIKFSDGSVWNNPGYEAWLKKYKGKKVGVKLLNNYYPYIQTIQ